jgi:hypothetical protein
VVVRSHTRSSTEEDFMIGQHHAARYVVRGIVIAAFLAAIAVPSAAAATSMRRAIPSEGCQSGAHWITVTDDQGIPSLVPGGVTACDLTLACSSTTETRTGSPYPGWAFVTDDLGLPWLVPIANSEPAGGEACVLAQGASAAVAVAPAGASAPAPAKKPAKKPLRWRGPLRP